MSSDRVMCALRKIAGWFGPTPYEEGKTPEERRNLLDKEINHWGRYGTISHLPRYRKLLDERNRLRVADATKTVRPQQSAAQPTAGNPRRGGIPFQPSIAAQPAAQPQQPRQIAAPVGQRAAAPQPAPNNEVQSFIDSFNPNSETFKSQYRDNWRFRDRFNKLRGENPDLYKGWQPPSGTYLY